MRYKFEVDELQTIIVEADSKEEARMKIIDNEVDTMLNCSCNDLNLDPCVSNGELVE
jgi:hypothetical protein